MHRRQSSPAIGAVNPPPAQPVRRGSKELPGDGKSPAWVRRRPSKDDLSFALQGPLASASKHALAHLRRRRAEREAGELGAKAAAAERSTKPPPNYGQATALARRYHLDIMEVQDIMSKFEQA